ncbi:hypothetical protein ACF049_05395 [Cellulosimicrobium funkei]|uniref:hypothetical protein n=1 Tax=Cellulosimicrobium funkei TaxID=264251 RepID=UPI0036F4D207
MYDFGNEIAAGGRGRLTEDRVGASFNMSDLLRVHHLGLSGIYGYERSKFGGVDDADEKPHQAQGRRGVPRPRQSLPVTQAGTLRFPADLGAPSTPARVKFHHDI